MLLVLDGKVAKIEGFMGDVKQTLEEVNRRTTKPELRNDKLKDQVVEALSDNMDKMQGVLNIDLGEVTERNDTLEAMVLALKEQIEELKGELNICIVSLGNRVLVVTPMPKVDI